MTILQIIVPVTLDKLHFLEECLRSIKASTPVDHVVNVVVGHARLEEKVGEVVAVARSVYNRTGLVITTGNPEHGHNGIVIDALLESDSQYTAVVPSTHRIQDGEWFGKMQQPLVKAPNCGMTFSRDDQQPNTMASYPWPKRTPIKSQFFMLHRPSIKIALGTLVDRDGVDIASMMKDRMEAVGAKVWCVPSCRIVSFDPEQ